MNRLLNRLCCWLVLSGGLLALSIPSGQAVHAGEKPAETLKGLPLVTFEDFESGSAERWEPTDKTAWELKKQGENTVYSLVKKNSNYKPPVRSPLNRSLLKDVVLTDTVLDVKLQSTSHSYGHQSLCLFFGFQDESHFYYVHFGKEADPHANQIFIVNGEPRKSISLTTTEGTNWTENWHHARVVRDTQTGKIEIYFDDMETPAMTAVDKTFLSGRVGVGSFDDPGNFDNVAVYGTPVKE